MAGNRDQRLDRLAARLAEGGVLHLRDAARLMDVSEMTIRRDIAASPGRFAFFGGHIMLATGEGPYDLSRAADRDAPAKKAACQHALRLVRPEETLFVDCGSTMMQLADILPEGMPLTIVCYALNIADRLSRNPSIRLILMGGLYHASSASFEGSEALALVDRIGINTAFLSAAGVDPDLGVSCAHFHEAEVKRRVMARAHRSVLVVDSGKFGKVRPACFASLSDFDQVLTENGPWQSGTGQPGQD